MSAKIFLGAFLLALTGAMAPGPLLSKTIAESLTKGWLAGPVLMIGHSMLEILLVFFLLSGFGHVFTHKTTQGWLNITGGGVLLWMSFTLFLELPGVKIYLNTAELAGNWFGLVLAGALISLANPYWSLWWATVGTAQLTSGIVSGKRGVFSFITGHLSADWVWYCLISIIFAWGRRFVSDFVYQIILGIVVSVILLFGLYFLWCGIKILIMERYQKPGSQISS